MKSNFVSAPFVDYNLPGLPAGASAKAGGGRGIRSRGHKDLPTPARGGKPPGAFASLRSPHEGGTPPSEPPVRIPPSFFLQIGVEVLLHSLLIRAAEVMAERVGFEPTDPFGSTVFETARFGHSRTSPHVYFSWNLRYWLAVVAEKNSAILSRTHLQELRFERAPGD